jgi:peptidyl-prolyl cis-trans isomerase D
MSNVEKSKKSVQTSTYIILGAALAAMTFFGVCDPGGGYSGPKGSAAVVGDEVISRGEFQRTYRNIYDQYQNIYRDSFDAGKLRVANSAMQQLVDSRLLYIRAKELGLDASESEVVEAIKSYNLFNDENGKWSDERYDNFLSNYGYTEKDFMAEIRRNVTLSKARNWLTSTAYSSNKAAEIDYQLKETKINVEFIKFDPQSVNVAVTAADAKKFLADKANKKKVSEYFEKNKKQYNKAEEVNARHILVSFKGARNASGDGAKRTKKAAKSRAEKILKSVKASGAKFADIAKKETDEASGKKSGGSLGWFTRDAMVKPFSDAAFKLKDGGISVLVESPFGFHIIKKEGSKAAKKTLLKDAQDGIAKKLLAKEKRPTEAKKQADAVLAQLKKSGKAKNLISSYKVKWENTGDVSADTPYLKGIGSTEDVKDHVLKLKKAGQLSASILDVRGSKYILRLKSRIDADLKNLKADKIKELSEASASQSGRALFDLMKQQAEKKYKDNIWKNPEYLALDNKTNDGA